MRINKWKIKQYLLRTNVPVSQVSACPGNDFCSFFVLFFVFHVIELWSSYEIGVIYQILVVLHLNTWCNPTLWQRFLSTESEMLRRRILVEERGRFPFLLLENCRKIDKGSSWIAPRDFCSSSKSRRRIVVLRSILTLKEKKKLHLWKFCFRDFGLQELLITSCFLIALPPVESI